jgi:hypothetical protein
MLDEGRPDKVWHDGTKGLYGQTPDYGFETAVMNARTIKD